MTVDARFRPQPGFTSPWTGLIDNHWDHASGLRELQAMSTRWHRRAQRTDRDQGCADELDEVLHETTLDELRMLAIRWHSLATLSGGSHHCANELDVWLLRWAIKRSG